MGWEESNEGEKMDDCDGAQVQVRVKRVQGLGSWSCGSSGFVRSRVTVDIFW